jgi:hypothetical protein
MPRKLFLKDMIFLMLCYLTLLLFALAGELNFVMALVMFVMYVGYIALVILMELRKKWKTHQIGTDALLVT